MRAHEDDAAAPSRTDDLSDLTLGEQDRRELIEWSTTCAERLTPLFAAHRPADKTLDSAAQGARSFARGQLGLAVLRQLALACHAAAHTAPTRQASAAARAMGHAVAVGHMAAHGRELARYTRKALTGEALERELAWQREHLPARFTTYVFPHDAPGVRQLPRRSQ